MGRKVFKFFSVLCSAAVALGVGNVGFVSAMDGQENVAGSPKKVFTPASCTSEEEKSAKMSEISCKLDEFYGYKCPPFHEDTLIDGKSDDIERFIAVCISKLGWLFKNYLNEELSECNEELCEIIYNEMYDSVYSLMHFEDDVRDERLRFFESVIDAIPQLVKIKAEKILNSGVCGDERVSAITILDNIDLVTSSIRDMIIILGNIDKCKYDHSELLRGMNSIIRSMNFEKGIRVDYRFEDGTPLRVVADQLLCF